jgi:nicotinamide-nucleotide amidase
LNAEIISVGSELLLGQIVNTNARFLSQQLAEIGVDVFYHTVVGDNPKRLDDAITIAEGRANIIVFTGGLGPTKDDLTKETISKHLRTQLKMDEEALESIENFFARTNRVMTENNKKQALVLEGSAVLKNDHGMAPGMLFKVNTKIYVLLPGPPKELEPMFQNYGKYAILRELDSKEFITSRILRFFGIGEAALEAEIEDLIDQQTNPTIAPLASDGEVTLRITAKHDNVTIAQQLLDEAEKNITARLGQFLYGYNETSLVLETFHLLKENGLTISCAESLTGGMFQNQLTAIPGSSRVFNGGIVCYSNESKLKLLNVNTDTLLKNGAVSSECAKELAENIASQLNSNIGISFTGVAGPDEQEGKAVGTVFIGISIKGRPTIVEKLKLAGSREAIRTRTVKYGYHFLLKHIISTYKQV